MPRANPPRPRLWRPHPSSWPSTEHDYSYRLENGTEKSSVGYWDSPFLPYVESRWTNGSTVVPSGIREPVAHRDQQQAPLERRTIYAEVQPSFEPLKMSRNDDSMSLPVETEATAHIGLIQRWMSTRQQIAILRHRTLSTRIEVKRERLWCHQQEEEFESVMESFMDRVDNPSFDVIDPQGRVALNQLSTELKYRRNDLKAVRGRIAALENDLSNYEYQLQRLEDDVYSELDKEPRPNELPFEPQVQSNSTHTIIPRDLGFDESVGLRDRLYSRMGDLRIHLERLNNFEYDLREELEERDLIRASGQADITTDVQFFEQTKADRARIQRDLEDAQIDVRELKEQCDREGIIFEEPELPDVLYHTETESDALTFDSPMYQPDVQQGSSSIIGAFFNAQDRVKRWLKEPSALHNMDDEEAPETPHRLTRRESSSSDKGWVWTPSPTERAITMGTGGEHGCTVLSVPEWRYGPPPGSSLLEALLLESASTPLGAYGSQSEARSKSKDRQSLS